MGWRRWLVGCAVGAAALAVHAAPPLDEVYQIGDGTEAIHLSNRAETAALRPLGGMRHSASRATPGLARLIDQAATAHRVDPALLHAVIDVESGFAVRAVSSRGALGLMQLMPATARDYGVTDAFDPRQNIDAGAQHLRRLLDRFGQDRTLALAAYNAGAGAVARHQGRMPPYVETMAYVPRVLQRLAVLQRDAR